MIKYDITVSEARVYAACMGRLTQDCSMYKIVMSH